MEKLMPQEKQGCQTKVVQISHKDLPLCCPTHQERVWDAHPRVYLPIETLGEINCPYCGTHFILQDFHGPEVDAQPADVAGY